MSIPVIDACVAIKWFIPENNFEKAGEILKTHNKMIAPDLFLIEFDSIVTKKVRQRLIESVDAFKMREVIRNLPFEIIPYTVISKVAFELSSSLPVTQYDACYLAAAIEFEQSVITADERFLNGMKNTPFESYVKPL